MQLIYLVTLYFQNAETDRDSVWTSNKILPWIFGFYVASCMIYVRSLEMLKKFNLKKTITWILSNTLRKTLFICFRDIYSIVFLCPFFCSPHVCNTKLNLFFINNRTSPLNFVQHFIYCVNIYTAFISWIWKSKLLKYRDLKNILPFNMLFSIPNFNLAKIFGKKNYLSSHTKYG